MVFISATLILNMLFFIVLFWFSKNDAEDDVEGAKVAYILSVLLSTLNAVSLFFMVWYHV